MLWPRKSTPAALVVVVDGKSTVFPADRQRLILEILEQGGIDHSSQCRIGSCGTCVMQLVSGKIRNLTDIGYVLKPDEIERGYFLPCQAQLRSETVVVTRLSE